MKSINLPAFPLRNQKGMVSITVTVVFIMVISLVVLGFSQVSRRNSREALDRQLSSQAFYAAETGVNDIMNEIAKTVEEGREVSEQEVCRDDLLYTRAGGVVDKENDTSYSCSLVSVELPSLKYDNVNDNSIIVPLNSLEGYLEENKFIWSPAREIKSDAEVKKCNKLGGQHPKANDWAESCPYGVMKIDLMPVNPEILTDSNKAREKTMTLFVYPKWNGGTNLDNPTTISYPLAEDGTPTGPVPQGKFETASCNKDACAIKVDGLKFTNGYAKIRMIYNKAASIQVFAKNVPIKSIDNIVEGGATEGKFVNGQVVIDVTGKARDVLRRIQVRMSLTGGPTRTNYAGFSDYAIRSADSICKLYEVSPTVNSNRATGCAD